MANAVLIDTIARNPALIDQNTQCGPIHGAGGALYMLLTNFINAPLQIFKSTNGGNAWTVLTTLANNSAQACVSFDGTRFWIFQQTSNGAGSTGTLMYFDAPTETFGPPHTGPANVVDVELCQSSNGNIHMITDAAQGIGRSLVLYSMFDGVVFTTATLYDISIADPVIANEMTQQIIFMDSSNNVHALAQSDTFEDPTSPRVWHWVMSSTGAIISTTQLVIGPVTTPLNSLALGKGCDADGTLYVLYGDSSGFIKALAGTGSLTAPIWTAMVIDGTAVVDPNFLGKGITVGSKSFLLYGVNHLLRMITVTGGMLGSPVTLYDSDTTPPPAPLVPGYIIAPTASFLPSLNALGIGFNLNSTSDNSNHGFFQAFPISAVVIPPFIGGGGPSSIGPSVSPFAPAADYNKSNVFTNCLCQKYSDWNCIDWDVVACCVPPDYTILGFPEDEDEMFDANAPYQYGSLVSGTRFYKQVVIPCPIAAAGDIVALNFTVPVGFDSVITGIIASYLGTGFFEGSGDLVFRIKLNRYFAKDLGRITTSLGTLQTPYPTQVLAGSLSNIQFIVAAPNGSGSVLPGTPIAMTLFGWWYGQDEAARWQKARRAA